jgi:hypothetical protein
VHLVIELFTRPACSYKPQNILGSLIGATIAEKGLKVVVIDKEIGGAQPAVQAEGGLGVTN